MSSRRALALATSVALTAATGPGWASDVPAIVWDAPVGCPDVGAVRAEVGRLVGAAVGTRVSEIRARVALEGDRWHLVVTLVEDGRVRERTLTTGTCEAAASAAAFVIAIAIDPAVDEAGSEPAPAARPEPAAPVLVPAPPPASAPVVVVPAVPDAPAVDSATGPPPPPRRRRGPQGLLQIGPGVQVGMTPVGPGLAAAAGLRWPRLRVALGYARWFPTSLPRAAQSGLGGELSVHTATARIGPVLRAGPLEFPLHLGVELGALRAVGVGGDENYARVGLWGAVTAGLALAWAPRALRGHGAVIVIAEGAIALHRPRLVFNESIDVYRIGPGAVRGQILLEARFP